jgi:hypothetical protein
MKKAAIAYIWGVFFHTALQYRDFQIIALYIQEILAYVFLYP